MTILRTLTLTLTLAPLVTAFVPRKSRSFATSNSGLFVVDPTIVEQTQGLTADLVSSSVTVGVTDEDTTFELVKAVLITLFFGGGLIPALIGGNKAMIETLSGKRRGGEDELDQAEIVLEGNLDPTVLETKYRTYVEDSGATGPKLPNSGLLFANEEIPVSDVVAIMGRIQDKDTLCDWENLPSTKREGILDPNNPPMWLPRGAFKVNVRKASWKGWPTDPNTGEPVGGADLQAAEESRVRQNDVLIGDAALDAVWDAWARGASFATPDKVAAQLSSWHPTANTFDLGKFVKAAISGRSFTALAAFTFILIQVVAFGTLFIGPFLRVFLDIDIGFGSVGDCDPTKCIKLSPF